MQTSYHRQRDTIITWLEEYSSVDLALSYQDLAGAQETWEIICALQGRDPNDFSQEEGSDDEVLPMPTLQNLSTIVGELTQATESKKKKIPNYVLADNVST